MARRRLPLLFVALLAGCAGMSGDRGATSELVGLYRGSFDSALTHDPADDLNFNPCERDHVDCQAHHAPLADILLEVVPATGGELTVVFYRSAADRDGGRPLDLLGSGCGTRLGPITEFNRVNGSDGQRWTGNVALTARNRLCLGRLRPTSEHALQLAWYQDHAEAPGRSLEVLIDRRVTDANYLYVEEDGVRRRVRIDRDNRLEQDGGTRYRVCIEDALGEYTRCVMTDRELRQVLLPVPLPGGAAVSYTWWHRLSPRLKSTRGLYHLEQYRGHFTAVED
jgi:hypothetical protein